MSAKDWVYQGHDQYGVYQEMNFESENDSPAVIEISHPADFRMVSELNAAGEAFGKLEAAIPAEVFDQIAIAWCKKRKLHAALGGPVGLEWGSPDRDWD